MNKGFKEFIKIYLWYFFIIIILFGLGYFIGITDANRSYESGYKEGIKVTKQVYSLKNNESYLN